MALSIQHDMLSLNADRMLGLEKCTLAKSTERLSSGYKINRAADDAAGLAISEKLRRIIRGLAQGTENAQDGISWVQIGDGALEEAQEMLQRMNELAIKSANGTNSDTDRIAMNDEFSQLKKELNRVSAATKFNDQKIFSDHKPLWYQTRGNIKWKPYDQHVIEEGKNELKIKYHPDSRNGSSKEITFTVPPGQYSTLELLDELDTAIMEQMDGYDTWFEVEYADDGHININLEGGAFIESVTGDLSYLLYEMYKGGGTGALLGTTIFTTDTDKLNIIAGRNDEMEFFIEDLKGNQVHVKDFKIDEGSYTRDELIEKINLKLESLKQEGLTLAGQDISVRATPYGRSIKLGSNKEFVTGFTGNMFNIDGPDYTSVFYDNVKSGDLSMYAAQFTGGCVMIYDSYSVDEEHKFLTFDDTNNELILQPDGCDAPVKITIDKGSYTLAQIRGKLETLFNNAGLHLNVGTWSENVQTGSPYGGTGYTTFYGLTITSDSKGPDSKIGIDPNSSAYNTLFVDRSYIYYGPKATTREDLTADRDASFTGSRNLGNVTAQDPLTLTSDNNSFSVSVKGTDDTSARSATITLTAGTYDSADAIVDEVNAQLANKGLGDLIKAKLSTGNTLQLVEAEHGDVTGYISVGAATGSNGTTADKNGYKTLFVEQTIKYDPKTVNGYGSISFDTPGKADGNTLTITVKGKSYTVDLSGIDKSDPEQIAQKINDTIKGETKTENYTFSSTPHGGTTTNNNFSSSNTSGLTTITPWSDSAAGKSGSTEGATGGAPSTKAALTIGPRLKASMDISAANNNNKIRLTINGRTETLTLHDGTYTQESLRKELQDQITAVFGEGSAGAAVTLNGDQLVITSNLAGNDSKVACGTGDSSLLAWLNTTKSGASCTGAYGTPALSNSITITDGTNDKFVFEYRGPGSVSGSYTTCELDLKGDTYDRDGIIRQINEQLAAKGLDSKIEAYLSGGRLGLRTKGDLVGDGTSIKYSTGNSSAADAMFGGLIKKNAAYVTTNRAIQDKITIESGKQQFTLKVDNTADGVSNPTDVTVELPTMTNATREDFLKKLNEQLAGKGVTASLDSNNRLQFSTTEAGSGTYVDVSYISPEANPSSAMQAIYGTYDIVYPAVKASFDENNKLTITAVKADGSTDTGTYITVNSRTSAGLLADTATPTETNPTSTSGYHSRTKAAIDGVSFSSYKLDGVNTAADTVVIDAYNNDLSFDVYYNGRTGYYDTRTHFSLTLDQKTYTYGELQQALQDKLDAADSPVAGKVNVTVNDNGVKIEAKNYGNAFQFRNLNGDFYYKVLSAGEEIHEKKTATDKEGYQVVNGAYTIGRKNVSGGAEIVEGVCDELSFDLVIQGKREKISMVLDPGKYGAQELIKEIQSKVDEQLVKKGLKPGLVEVNIGGIDSGIAGNNDHNALNFRISKDVQAPQVGDYLIEGITGNAAFEIFYQTEGKIIPAYIMGSKDVVSKGVTIGPDDGDLTIAVDDDVYTINLDPGTYTANEIIDALNEAFGDDIPLTASINRDDGRVKLSYEELGHHEFKYVTGGAKDDVFFDETGGRDNTYRNIQLSSEIPDYIPIKRSEFNTNMLRISSLNVLGERYALKAIDRLSMAINRVSALRTDFGVTQNRLEHAINSNQNKEENVTAAESRIRDTDMAKEMVKYANLKILEQAGLSVLAQAGRNRNTILNLLQ